MDELRKVLRSVIFYFIGIYDELEKKRAKTAFL